MKAEDWAQAQLDIRPDHQPFASLNVPKDGLQDLLDHRDQLWTEVERLKAVLRETLPYIDNLHDEGPVHYGRQSNELGDLIKLIHEVSGD